MARTTLQNGRVARRLRAEVTAVSVSGYKSFFAPQRLEIGPLTILAGPNSSGKSSVMQPLLLLKQTLEAPYDPGPLLLNGPNVRLASVDQLLSRLGKGERATEMHLEFEGTAKLAMRLVFKKSRRAGVELDAMSYLHKDHKAWLTLRREMSSEEIAAVVPDSLMQILGQMEQRKKLEFTIARDRCFLSIAWMTDDGLESAVWLQPPPYAGLVQCIENLIHVPPVRGNPERTYRTTAVGKKFPGTFENYVASIVSHWEVTRNRRLKDLGTALEALGLTWKVEPRMVDDTQVELRVGRLPHALVGGAYDLVSIADVGFGVSQVLPVVVALLVSEPRHTVYIEEPETHLHPHAQVAMAQLLADAANRGVTVVAETHSDLLLRGIQTVVARGGLSPSDVKLHWFTRTSDGATEISSGNLDRSGAFGEWPADFDQVVLESERAYLDAAERRPVAAG